MARTANGSKNDKGSDRRQQILAIAARLFARQGYNTTTVRDIADEAGILSGSLYHHFQSKEAITQEILRDFFDNLLEQYGIVESGGFSASEAYERLVRVSFETIGKHNAAVGLYQNEALFLRVMPGFEFVREQSRRIEEIWLNQIKRGQESGEFRDGLDAAVIYRFVRDGLWSTVRWYHPDSRHSPESLAETFLAFTRHGLLAN